MKKILLDVDTGIDDTLSLAYMCARNDVEIIGVSCVYGNVDVMSAARNTKALLSMFNKNEVPVYFGAEHALEKESYTQQRGGAIFHGVNGIGEVELPQNLEIQEGAVQFIIDSANKYLGELIVVASGPLTNIAKAIEKDPKSMSKIKEIVLMGGALTVPGNVSPYSEANISQDALASKIVFESGINITMIGLDVTSRAIISREEISHWNKISVKGKTLYNIMDHYFKAHELIYPSWGGAAMHDPLAAVVALESDIVKTIQLPMTVLTDEKQPGRTVMDLSRIEDKEKHTVKVAIDLDAERFKKLLISEIDTII